MIERLLQAFKQVSQVEIDQEIPGLADFSAIRWAHQHNALTYDFLARQSEGTLKECAQALGL